MKRIDMSEKAILQRLRTVDRLRDLCLALMKVKKKDDPYQTELDAKETEGKDTKNHENIS